MGHVAAVAIAVVGPLLAVPAAMPVPVPDASAARAAAVITVTPVITATYPRQVPKADSGRTVRVDLVVSSTEPVDGVTAAAWSDEGLVITDAYRSLGTLGTAPVALSFDVAGVQPGLHPLQVTVSAPGATGGNVSIPYMWTSGSPLLTGTNGVYSRTYGWQGTRLVPGQAAPTRAVRMFSIVSKRFAYVGLPAHGLPDCVTEGNGCVAYAWDYKLGVLQVGPGIIGTLRKDHFYSDGLIPPDEQSGEVFGRHEFTEPVTFTGRRSKIIGTWRYAAPPGSTGLTFQKVSFRRDGTYRLAFGRDGGPVKKLRGTFKLGRHGAVTFRSEKHRVVQRGTVAFADRPRIGARATPGTWTLWLVLSGRKGTRPDGNLLQPVPSRP